jgi:hypothetical protein
MMAILETVWTNHPDWHFTSEVHKYFVS